MKNAEEGRSEVQDKSEDSESDKISIKRPKKRGKKLIMNVSLTKYQVVRKTATQFFG